MHTDLQPTQLEPGDILLCRGNTEGCSVNAYVRREIAAATSSPYTHAALYLGDGEIVDARVLQGIRVRPFTELLAASDYVAAIRQPDVWSIDRVEKLREFARKLHNMNMKYNTDPFKGYVLQPMLKRRRMWVGRQEGHRQTIMEQVEALFKAGAPSSPEDPLRQYFCSELVVSALAVVGYLGFGADKIYNPAYLAPGDLVRDHTFGFLVGYLAKGTPHAVPGDDPLLDTPLVSEVPSWGI